jgi:hypothetical protein
MTLNEAKKIRTGTELAHCRKGKAIARGPLCGETVWIDVPEDALAPDIPYNAHISALEFSNED